MALTKGEEPIAMDKSKLGPYMERLIFWVQEVPERRAVLTITPVDLQTEIWGPGADTAKPWRLFTEEAPVA